MTHPSAEPTPSRLRRLLRNTYALALIWFVFGGASAVIFGLWIQPRWVNVCSAIRDGPRCGPVDEATAVGYSFFLVAGIALVVAPIVASLWEIRHGGPWEVSRVEPAKTNLAILAAFLYVGLGALAVSVIA